MGLGSGSRGQKGTGSRIRNIAVDWGRGGIEGQQGEEEEGACNNSCPDEGVVGRVRRERGQG